MISICRLLFCRRLQQEAAAAWVGCDIRVCMMSSIPCRAHGRLCFFFCCFRGRLFGRREENQHIGCCLGHSSRGRVSESGVCGWTQGTCFSKVCSVGIQECRHTGCCYRAEKRESRRSRSDELWCEEPTLSSAQDHSVCSFFLSFFQKKK